MHSVSYGSLEAIKHVGKKQLIDPQSWYQFYSCTEPITRRKSKEKEMANKRAYKVHE